MLDGHGRLHGEHIERLAAQRLHQHRDLLITGDTGAETKTGLCHFSAGNTNKN